MLRVTVIISSERMKSFFRPDTFHQQAGPYCGHCKDFNHRGSFAAFIKKGNEGLYIARLCYVGESAVYGLLDALLFCTTVSHMEFAGSCIKIFVKDVI